MCFPALVSRSCGMRLPTFFAVRISPVFLRMYSEMNLLRLGNRVSPRGDLDSAGAYFSRPAGYGGGQLHAHRGHRGSVHTNLP